MNLKLALGLILCGPVTADMYLQFPGGSNNRLNEPNRATRNANRLFDSQNNNRFGHNQHGHYFYTNSEIDMQWTVQHSCGPDSNLNCDVILQYACEDNLRDGQELSTIPIKSEDCDNEDCNSDYNYGMHEDYQSYQHCTLRERNKGLYQADRHLRGQDARFTRQENNGQRYGYECNEERDHYPYWHPTIWKDIAVFTDDTSRCSYYQMESENVKGRWYCKVSDEFLNDNYDPNDRDYLIPINKEDCEDLEGAQWVLSDPHTYPNGKSMPPPMCMEAPYQRDNHHGNGDSRYFVGHKWTVPEDLVHPSCSIRIRYNITSSDYNAWNIGNDATEYNRRIADIPTTHDGKCYDMAKGPALYGNEYNEIDVDNAVVITRQADIGLKFTRQSLQDDFWRLETGSRGWQWFGWEIPEFKNKKVKVSFDVRFRKKPTASNCGVKFYGVMEQSWIATAPIGEWKTVEITRDLPNSGDSYRVTMSFDNAPVDLDLRGFQICNLDDDVCYAFGEGPATLSGLSFEESKADVKNDLAIIGPRDLSIKMTRDATDRDVWKLQTFSTRAWWQWFGWESRYLAYKKVKVSFDVKFKTKPIYGTSYGMRFFGKWRREWIEEAPIGEWHHVDFEEVLPEYGDNYRILMAFNYNLVDLELKNLNLCVDEDQSRNSHDGKCYDMAKGPALYGDDYSDVDIDNAVVITREQEMGLKFTRQSLQDDFWRLETGSRGWQWFGWEIPEFRNKKVKVSFDVRFRKKPIEEGNRGLRLYGRWEKEWIATAPIGEWKTVEITRDLPNSGDSYRVLIGLDSAPVDLDLRGFQICNLDDDVCYAFGEGPATLSGLSFEESKADVKNDLAIVGPRDLSIKMTRDATDRDVWKLQTFKRDSGWQWFGWESSHLAYKTVKVSFDVKFKTKPTNGNQYGMRFFGKWRREWIEEAPIGEWYHVDFVETLPRSGDKSRILMAFNYNVVELELKNLNLCVEEDDLFYEVNPFASMQDELDFSAYTARKRGYEHRNDARLQIFESIPMRLRSAYNTDQLGRVFEDRSHQIEFVELSQEIKQDMRVNNKKLYNLNARGKIGNNVEVYPAFEYDFVPSRLVANEGDYLHIQFSGSNTNDHGNDHSQVDSKGETVRILRGKDRHNMVAIDRMDAIRPTAELEQLSSLLGLTARESMSLAFSGVKGGDNEYLQSAGAYFDLGPKKLTKKGKHMFMSTINSAHGVRIQKGKIIVNEPDDGFSMMVNGPDDGPSMMVNGPDDGPSMMENEPDDGPSMMGVLN